MRTPGRDQHRQQMAICPQQQLEHPRLRRLQQRLLQALCCYYMRLAPDGMPYAMLSSEAKGLRLDATPPDPKRRSKRCCLRAT